MTNQAVLDWVHGYLALLTFMQVIVICTVRPPQMHAHTNLEATSRSASEKGLEQ